MATSSSPEYRYLPGGTVKHWFEFRSPEPRSISRCGISPKWYEPGGWMGTGSQEEYDKVKALKLCGRCRILKKKDEVAADAADLRAREV